MIQLAFATSMALHSLPVFSQNNSEVSVEWPCRTRSGQVQDEYCEWNASTAPNGNLRCTYTTTFDSDRNQFLTQKNRFNSKDFLVQLIGSCTQTLVCNGSDCVPSRQADPAVCRAVANIANQGCNVRVKTFPLASPNDSAEKIRLVIGAGSERSFCRFVSDPKTKALDQTLLQCDIPGFSAYKSCEQLAESVFVKAVLVKQSCGF